MFFLCFFNDDILIFILLYWCLFCVGVWFFEFFWFIVFLYFVLILLIEGFLLIIIYFVVCFVILLFDFLLLDELLFVWFCLELLNNLNKFFFWDFDDDDFGFLVFDCLCFLGFLFCDFDFDWFLICFLGECEFFFFFLEWKLNIFCYVVGILLKGCLKNIYFMLVFFDRVEGLWNFFSFLVVFLGGFLDGGFIGIFDISFVLDCFFFIIYFLWGVDFGRCFKGLVLFLSCCIFLLSVRFFFFV